jgi:hypothetical protein
MTECEWLRSTDPEPMLEYLRRWACERKTRLVACATAREVWHLLTDPRSRTAVYIAEQFADDRVAYPNLTAAFNAAYEVWKEIPLRLSRRHGKWVKSQAGSRAAKEAAHLACIAANPELNLRMGRYGPWRGNARERYALANHLRDIFGNPFQTPVLNAICRQWNGGTVPKFAQAIYDDATFADLPILADALEDAGCTDANILDHCRSAERHTRGCWVVDLLCELPRPRLVFRR